MKGKLEAAKVLFEYKADANFCSLLVDKTWTKHPYFSETNVHRAINTNQFHFVDLFMSNGADLTIPNVKGSNPLHNICFCGQLDMLKLILKHRDNNISVRIALTKGMVTFWSLKISEILSLLTDLSHFCHQHDKIFVIFDQNMTML